MQLSYLKTDQGLKDAAAFVNDLSHVDEFWEAIASHPKFDYTKLSSGEIARRIRACTQIVTVEHHTFPSHNTVAATDPGWPYRIYYGTWHLNRSAKQKVNTLVHEFVHNVDIFENGVKDFGHGDTDPVSATQGTAPYRIGDLAQGFWETANQHVARITEGERTAEPGGFVCLVGSLRHDETEQR